jgi:hypothetical protein
MISPFVSLWTSQSCTSLCFFWTASTQRLGYDILRPSRGNADLEQSTRARQKAGDAGDTVLRETGEKKRMPCRSFTGVIPFGSGHELLHIARRCRFCSEHFSEMPVGRRGCWFCGSERQFNPASQEAQSI